MGEAGKELSEAAHAIPSKCLPISLCSWNVRLAWCVLQYDTHLAIRYGNQRRRVNSEEVDSDVERASENNTIKPHSHQQIDYNNALDVHKL